MAIHLLEQMPDTLWAKSPGRAEGCYFLGVFEGGGFGVAEGDCVCVKMVAFCLEKWVHLEKGSSRTTGQLKSWRKMFLEASLVWIQQPKIHQKGFDNRLQTIPPGGCFCCPIKAYYSYWATRCPARPDIPQRVYNAWQAYFAWTWLWHLSFNTQNDLVRLQYNSAWSYYV